MKVKRLKQDEISKSLDLVWRVFCRYEAANYPESSKAAFWQAIHSEDYLSMLTAYGAFDDSRLVGVITVHSSQYAASVYAKLGFIKTGDIQTENGITFIPMVF